MARWRSPIAWLRELWRHLRTEHTSSGRLVAAVALGLFVGTLPLYGLHLPICVALSVLFGLNKVTTYLAANVSNPLFTPFLVFGSVQLGERVLRGRFLALTVGDLERMGPTHFLGSWWAGAPLLGVALAALGGAITWLATAGRRRRERAAAEADPFVQASRAVAERYRPLGRFAHGYVSRKIRMDPVYRALAGRIPADVDVLDVGTGRGQLALCLGLAGPGRRVVGIDWDAAKVELARRAGSGLGGLSFEVGDLRTASLEGPAVGAVLLVDVLHYLPPAEQDELLARAAARVAPGGTLWIREVDAGAGWRARLTVLEERIFTGLRFNRGAVLHFRPARAIAARLEAAGLVTAIEPMWQGTPFANVLVTGRRPGVSLGGSAPEPRELAPAE